MNLQKKLQNMGIEQIDKIDPEFVRLIAYNVTEALTKAFLQYTINITIS